MLNKEKATKKVRLTLKILLANYNVGKQLASQLVELSLKNLPRHGNFYDCDNVKTACMIAIKELIGIN